MSNLDLITGNPDATQACVVLKVIPLNDKGRMAGEPATVLNATNRNGEDRWDVYISKLVYPTPESYGALATILRLLADDLDIAAHQTEMENHV